MDYVNPVREGVNKFLTKKPYFVKIMPERINDYAKKVKDEPGLFYLPDWKVHNEKEEKIYPDDDWSNEDVIDFFGIVNNINFLFWHSGKNGFRRYERKGIIGSNAMFVSVKENFERLRPKGLINAPVTVKEMRSYFGNLPMIKQRTNIFNEVGSAFKEGGYESFKDFFGDRRKAFDHGDGLVELLVNELPSFNDFGNYNGLKIPFNKRAQLCIAMLYERLGPSDFPVDDINELTIFADYQVPKGLELEGLIKYSRQLKKRITNHELIKKNTVMENEIRANAIKACSMLVEKVNDAYEADGLDKRINDLNTDGYFWYKSTKNDEPFHLTRTTAY